MVKIISILSFFFCVNTLFAFPVHAQEIWVGKDGSVRNIDARALIAGRGELYLATRREIFRTRDSDGRWEAVFSIAGGENELNCLAGNSRHIFAGTRRGLLRSSDHGRTWKNVFRTIMPGKNNVVAIEMSKHNAKRIVVVTEKGIFTSDNLGDGWRNISENIRNKHPKCISLNKERMYAGTEEGLYARAVDSPGWERLYINNASEEAPDDEMDDYTDYDSEKKSAITSISLNNSHIYAAIDKKIMYSDTEGKSWKTFTTEGIAGSINYLAVRSKPDKFYCATTKGVFEYSEEKSRWLELYKGMDKVYDIRKVVFDEDAENSLWALTGRGLFRLEPGKYANEEFLDIEKGMKTLKITLDSEPSFRELKRQAMKVAEVGPDKIRGWRNQARIKALLPKVSFGIDNNRRTNYEIYTSATKDYVAMGPDDLSNGVDVSVSWELGDLIWSSDQTSIDVRSRLTTQLRNDILDDLRRAYYERKRLLFELMQSPPADPKTRFEKEMRINELTQVIDDLTGDYLSDVIEGRKKRALI